MNHTATYSPDDNKLRLYPAGRLSAEEFERMKAHGFKWAPKQSLFVAPMWTPSRADLLEEMAGEIGDEDKTLAERADERSERFEEYSEKRAEDAQTARKAVASIQDGIPLGQPILIGHHSEKHARRDAERIENGMRKAVKMWETSEYWTRRAAGAVRHAMYKERADVRARRIKSIEADKRKQEKYIKEAETFLKAWNTPGLTLEQARHIANFCRLTVTRTNADGTACTGYSGWSAYDVLQPDEERYKACPAKTVQDCINAANKAYPRTIANCKRWIEHYENRLAYERAMLADAGGIVSDRVAPEVGGAVQCLWSPRGGWAYIKKVNKVTVTIWHQWNLGGRVFKHNEPLDKLHKIMSRADVEKARDEGRIKEAPENIGFWLMQSREEFDAGNPPKIESKKDSAQADEFKAMRETLRAGVQVVTAPQLFPTPRDLAQRVADMADIQPGMRVLEPSAGTGVLLGAMGGRMFGHNPERGAVHAIEINRDLARRLQAVFPLTNVHCNDFLENVPEDFEPFDRIVMNPPFADGADIKHIKHAMKFLKSGGRIVAICANGPRQAEALKPIAAEWVDLPSGSFKESGTMVNAAIVVIENP